MKVTLRVLFGFLIVFISVYFLIYPSAKTLFYVHKEASSASGISDFASDVHYAIAQDFGAWARQRVEEASGADLSLNNISGTEWPMFSAVYFLWATQKLDKAWLEADRKDAPRPTQYAADAIEAAVDLVVDPANANWVIRHWGDRYLETENIFYRMLLIAGLTSYQSMTGNNRFEPVLKNQVRSLARELDQSPHGVLDDYPGECYPIDILPAIAVIQRAGDLLDLDLGDFVQRARRGFEGSLLDPQTGLPSYRADSVSGVGIGPARGVGVSYKLIWVGELWPDTAAQWYGRYQRHFVQQDHLLSGVREYREGLGGRSSLGDVDSGPILAGYGVAASAFGIGAARVNGDVALAHALSTQAILASWPLPTGRLLVPSLLSDLSDAPFLGETALLFVLTRPVDVEVVAIERNTPNVVFIVLATAMLIGLLLLFWGLSLLRSALKAL